jgi:hypothetical protein
VPACARPSGRFRPWTCRQDSLRALPPPTESAVCSDMRGWLAFKWQNSSSGNAGPEWVLCGGEMLQEEMTGFHSKDKDIKHKTLMLAALRVAALIGPILLTFSMPRCCSRRSGQVGSDSTVDILARPCQPGKRVPGCGRRRR